MFFISLKAAYIPKQDRMEILTSLLLLLAIASCADEAAAGSIQHDSPDSVAVYTQEMQPDAIIGKEFVYALINVERPSYYPVIFAVIADCNDTINVDTLSLENFIQGICEDAVSAPIDAIECYDTFYRFFGKSGQTRNICDSSYMSFFDQFDNHYTLKSFTLGTGEHVTIKYASCLGLVADVSGRHSISVGLNTDDYPCLQKRCIPIAIFECRPSNNVFLINCQSASSASASRKEIEKKQEPDAVD